MNIILFIKLLILNPVVETKVFNTFNHQLIMCPCEPCKCCECYYEITESQDIIFYSELHNDTITPMFFYAYTGISSSKLINLSVKNNSYLTIHGNLGIDSRDFNIIIYENSVLKITRGLWVLRDGFIIDVLEGGTLIILKDNYFDRNYPNPTINVKGTAFICGNYENFIINIIDQGMVYYYCDINLPIELDYFDYSILDDSIMILWRTLTEINNNYFTIEKSLDLINWIFVENVKGSGNSNIPIEYNIIDKNPYIGISYYRLKQTDYDYKYEYFKPIVVIYNNINNISIKNNVLKVTSSYIGEKYRIYDLLGRLIMEDIIYDIETYLDVNYNQMYLVEIKNNVLKFVKK